MAFGDLSVGLSGHLKCRMRTRYTISIPLSYSMKSPDFQGGGVTMHQLDEEKRYEFLGLYPKGRMVNAGSWWSPAKVDYSIKRFCTYLAPNCPDSSISITTPGAIMNDHYILVNSDGTQRTIPVDVDMDMLATLVVDVDEDCGICPGGSPPGDDSDDVYEKPSESGGPIHCKCRVTKELGPFTPETVYIKDPVTGDLTWCTKWTRVWRQECFDVTDPDDDPGELPAYVQALTGLEAKQAAGDITDLQRRGKVGGNCFDKLAQGATKCCKSPPNRKCCDEIIVSWLDCPNNVSNFTVGSGGSSSQSAEAADNTDYSLKVNRCLNEEVIETENVLLFNLQSILTQCTIGWRTFMTERTEEGDYPLTFDAGRPTNFINTEPSWGGIKEINLCLEGPEHDDPNGLRLSLFTRDVAAVMMMAIEEKHHSTGADIAQVFAGQSWKDGIEKAVEENVKLCNGVDWEGRPADGNHKGIDEAMADIKVGLCKALACTRPGPNEDDPNYDNVGCYWCYYGLRNGSYEWVDPNDYSMGKKSVGPCVSTEGEDGGQEHFWPGGSPNGETVEGYQDGPGDPQPCLEWDKLIPKDHF